MSCEVVQRRSQYRVSFALLLHERGGGWGSEEQKRCKQEKRRGRTEEKEIDSGTGVKGRWGGLHVSVTIEMETEGGDEYTGRRLK